MHRTTRLGLTLLLLTACGGGGSDEAVGGDTDTTPALTQQTVNLSYVDAAGDTRAFQIEIRPPIGGTAPHPIVVWSHGGASGRGDATAVGTGWADAFTTAGYCMVAIAHRSRNCASQQRLMQAVGFVPPQVCQTWKYLSWDRPHDCKRVLDYLDEQTAPGGAFEGLLDTSRLAYCGHSAGGGSALVVAGAQREIAGVLTDLSDPRPVAFISCSPQGVGFDDFTTASYQNRVSRPHLSLTGQGDTTGGIPDATTRRDPFTLIAPGDKYIGWIQDFEAAHGVFNGETDTCEGRGATPTQCDDYVEWVRTAALTFLAAYVKGDATAMATLQGTDLSTRTGGTMVWMTR